METVILNLFQNLVSVFFDTKNILLKNAICLLLQCNCKGELAHLVERQVRNLKVVGSSPIFSTRFKTMQSIVFSLLSARISTKSHKLKCIILLHQQQK